MNVQFTSVIPEGFDTLLFLVCQNYGDPDTTFCVPRPEGDEYITLSNDLFVCTDTFGTNWSVVMPLHVATEHGLMHCA